MERNASLASVAQRATPYDLIVIGGGATGASVALDAATRGLSVLLLEQSDFGKGTSSRSTKLIHGGVRYLAQGNLSLVRGALRERSRLRANAPHLVRERMFLVPYLNRLQHAWYRLGFMLYDRLAASREFRKSRSLSSVECRTLVPTLRAEHAGSGVLYSDGQFDDCRLLISLLQTADRHGATVLNYARVTGFDHSLGGRLKGLHFTDEENGTSYCVAARAMINAAGPFVDQIRAMDLADVEPMLALSQGVHIVLPSAFLPGDTAVIVPRTRDGRVIFMIPWHDHTLVGTTDTPIHDASVEPRAQPEEIQLLLATVGEYLNVSPNPSDIQSIFVGIRPLIRPRGRHASTAGLSRDHVIARSASGLITISGGKWTTARKMGEDAVDAAIASASLPHGPCVTATLRLHGAPAADDRRAQDSVYGTDVDLLDGLAKRNPDLNAPLIDGFPIRGAEVVWAVEREMARTVEDVLARRTRLLFVSASAAKKAAPYVARWMAEYLGHDEGWQHAQVTAFSQLADSYCELPATTRAAGLKS